MTRPALAAGLVVLVVAAGCSALDPGIDRTPYDVPPRTASLTPTETPSPTPTVTATSGVSVTQIPEAAEQERWLRLIPNYTVEFARTVTIQGTDVLVTNLSCRVDVANDRGRCRRWYGQEGSTDPAITVTYHGEGRLRSKRTGGGTNGTAVADGDRTPLNTSIAVLEEWRERLEGVALERNGTVTFQGEVTTRYTASGPAAAPEGADLSEYRVVVLVDDWKAIRYVAVETVDDLGTRTEWTIAVTDVAETTVTRPEWVDTGPQNGSRKN